MNNNKHGIKSKGHLLSDIGIVGLVPERWGELWQVRHHVLTRLSEYFQVVWFNRPLGWREYLHLNSKKKLPSIPDSYGNMMIYTPGRWLPLLFRPVSIGKFLEKQRLKQAIKLLRRKGCKHILLYIWRPEYGCALDLLDNDDYDLSFYHLDDEYSFSTIEQETSAVESALLRRVDQVFIHSPELMAKKGHFNRNTQYVSNGVDFGAFSTIAPEPEDIKNIPHPRIGYMGVIKEQLDFYLLSNLINSHPEWSFVFVGPCLNIRPIESTLAALEKKKNVFFLGGKPVGQLPAYVQHFDVCTLCYKIDGYTKYIYPLKINEYLATGRPVVGAHIPSIELFKNVVQLARTSDEWSDAISMCLESKENTEEKKIIRRDVARRSDWNQQVHLIARKMCEHLGDHYLSLLNSKIEKELQEGSHSQERL